MMRWVCQKAPAALATFQDYLSGQELAGRRQGWDGDQGGIGPGQDRAVAAVGEWERKAGGGGGATIPQSPTSVGSKGVPRQRGR